MSSSHKADPSLIPDIEAFEERAVIAQYDGGLTRNDADDRAAMLKRDGTFFLEELTNAIHGRAIFGNLVLNYRGFLQCPILGA
jgi:hypothetical protein